MVASPASPYEESAERFGVAKGLATAFMLGVIPSGD
jgi:hypothetical protein